jgi:hypothetical protein
LRPATVGFDDTTAKIVRYDFEGHLCMLGEPWDRPGFVPIHGASVDQEGNLTLRKWPTARAKFPPARVRIQICAASPYTQRK